MRLSVDVFVYGSFELVDRGHRKVFCYRRSHGEECAIVVLNFSGEIVEWTVPEAIYGLLAR